MFVWRACNRIGASLPDCSLLSLLGCCCKLFMANAKFLALASLQALALATIMYRARDWPQVQRLLGTAPACGSPSEFVIVSRHVVTPDGTFPAAGMLLVSEAPPTFKAGVFALLRCNGGLLCTLYLHFLCWSCCTLDLPCTYIELKARLLLARLQCRYREAKSSALRPSTTGTVTQTSLDMRTC